MKTLDLNNLNNQFQEIKTLLSLLMNENKKLNNANEKLNADNEKLNADNNTIKERMENLEKDIKSLKKDNEKIKSTINHIQLRELSKNYLSCFSVYLTDEDKNLIKKDPSKREKIFEQKLLKNKPKIIDENIFNLILKITVKAARSLSKGNSSAHSLEIQFYREKIENYKRKLKIDILDNTKIFRFLLGIGVEDELLEKAFGFLTNREKFDDQLSSMSWRIDPIVFLSQ